MWFDVAAALAEIAVDKTADNDPALRANPAIRANPAPLHSTISTNSTPPEAAAPSRPDPAPRAPDSDNADAGRHGESPGGRPLTYTGRVVSLEKWRTLSAWERHGPDGRHWCGITRQWEHNDGGRDG